MNAKQIALKGFADTVPIFCGTIACISMVVTSYQIDYSLTLLIPYCVFISLLLSFWMNVPKYGNFFGAMFIVRVLLLCTFRMKKIGLGATVFAYRLISGLPTGISRLFDLDALSAAAVPIEDPRVFVTLFLMAVAAVIGLMLAFSLIRSKMVLLPLLIPLPMLLVSLIYTNRQPAFWTIMLLSVFFGYTLLGNGLRRGDDRTRGWLIAILAPALLLLTIVIMEAFPQKSYTPIAPEVRNEIFSERFGLITDKAMSWFGIKNPRSIDLSDEGERKEDDSELFTVYARNGTFLLRTHSYGQYGNNKWRAADRYKGEWQSMAALGKRQEQADSTMWILDSISGERIVPYAWTDEPTTGDANEQSKKPLSEESFIRSYGWQDYSWRYTSLYRLEPRTVTKEESAYYEKFAMEQYVMPDGEEKSALLDILNAAGIKASGDALETAKAVAAFVRDSGEYSVTPGKVPRGKDFILYFLTENHKGYCVHFASATTALLQALEIPARYTVGYHVQIPPELRNKGMPVTKNNEHAWAEVYVLGVGWVPIESTPGWGNDREGFGAEGASGEGGGAGEAEPTPEPTPVPPTPIPEEPEPTPRKPEKPDLDEIPTPPDQSGANTNKKRGSAWWILILLLPAAWVGTGLLIRRRREQRFRDPNVKHSIPEMAHYLDRLMRFGVKKDPDADKWALEAAFSNHKMQEEHRALLKRVHEAQKAVFKDKPALRFLLRWVLYLI